MKPVAALLGLLAGYLCAGPAFAESGFSDEQKENSHKYAISGRDAYWQCLAEESVKAIAAAITAQDFKLLIEGSCAGQRQQFRVQMADYMGMMYPDVPVQTNLTAADNAIALAQADAVNFFIKHRSAKK